MARNDDLTAAYRAEALAALLDAQTAIVRLQTVRPDLELGSAAWKISQACQEIVDIAEAAGPDTAEPGGDDAA